VDHSLDLVALTISTRRCKIGHLQGYQSILLTSFSVEPIEKLLATRWELTFQRRVPKVLKHITTRLNRMLSQFHKLVEKRVLERGVGIPGLHFLSQHVDSSQRTFDALVERLFAIVSEKQKEANRELVPVISEAMADGYSRCVEEHGAGSYSRMKGHMLKHVNECKDSMFEKATESVKNHLRKMRAEVEEQMREETEIVFQAMRREYFAVIVGTKLPDGYVMPRDERKLRRDVGDLVKEADEQFGRVINDVEDLENMKEESEKGPSKELKLEDDVMKDVEDGDEMAHTVGPSATSPRREFE
jgi:DNA anti-recombination protein RmuC